MKKIITVLAGLFIWGMAFGQGFEGRIIYQNSYHTKLSKVDDDEWNGNMGTLEEYVIKGGNYKIVTNGRLFEWQCYNNKTNKIYTKMGNTSSIYWNDASIDRDSILHVDVKKNDTVILGYKCDEMILTSVNGVQKFYYNSKLGVNAKLYEKHKFGNWSDYLDVANALPLETITDNEQFTLTSVAIEIKSSSVNNQSFVVTDSTRLLKSPY